MTTIQKTSGNPAEIPGEVIFLAIALEFRGNGNRNPDRNYDSKGLDSDHFLCFFWRGEHSSGTGFVNSHSLCIAGSCPPSKHNSKVEAVSF